MPKRRLTNNSVSTVEEQNLLIRIMSERGGANASTSQEGISDKKVKGKRKASAALGKEPLPEKAKEARAEPRAEPRAEVPRRAGDVVELDPVTSGDRSRGLTSMAGGGASVTLSTAASAGALNMGPAPLPMPFFFPPQPQQYPGYFPAPGQYAGFGQPMGCQEMMDGAQDSDENWELETEPGSEPDRSGEQGRPVHSISDDDDDIPACSKDQDKPVLDFENLKAGKMAQWLKETHRKATEADRPGENINPTLAKIIDEFFEETKVLTELERLAKEFPKTGNITKLVVPKLDQELFGAIDQNVRTADVFIQSIQKGLTAAIAATAPIAAFMLERGDTDPELDGFSTNIVKAIQLEVLALKALSTRRREQIKPYMQNTYAKAMAKAHDGDPQWLYGGNLSETTRKCEIAKKMAEKIVKRKQTPQQNNTNQQRQQGGRGGFGKKVRGNNPNHYQKSFGYGSQNVPYQMQYQQTPFQYQAYQAYQPYYQNQSYKKGQGQQNGGQQQQQGHQQDFRPRGPRK